MRLVSLGLLQDGGTAKVLMGWSAPLRSGQCNTLLIPQEAVRSKNDKLVGGCFVKRFCMTMATSGKITVGDYFLLTGNDASLSSPDRIYGGSTKASFGASRMDSGAFSFLGIPLTY
jgi:hypothetical protein